MNEHILFCIKDPKTNLYWNGEYHSKPWTKRVRFFKSLGALLSSLGLRIVPHEWRDEYERSNPYPFNTSERGAWYLNRDKAEAQFRKESKRTSKSVIQAFCEEKGYVLYQMREKDLTS